MTEGAFKPKVVLSLITDNGRFLLIRRKNPAFGVEWAFPGGVMHEGEKEEETAVREAKEEVNLTVKCMEKLLERRHPDTFVPVSYFHCELIGGDEAKVGQPHEITEVAWVPAKEIFEKTTSDIHPKIKEFILSKAKN
jgi:8-oxo-dGTP pyrophosphatase MutT (NUDIX family)